MEGKRVAGSASSEGTHPPLGTFPDMPAFSDSTSDTLAAALSAVPTGTPVSGVAGQML